VKWVQGHGRLGIASEDKRRGPVQENGAPYLLAESIRRLRERLRLRPLAVGCPYWRSTTTREVYLWDPRMPRT
jgi:hypothetical protein